MRHKLLTDCFIIINIMFVLKNLFASNLLLDVL